MWLPTFLLLELCRLGEPRNPTPAHLLRHNTLKPHVYHARLKAFACGINEIFALLGCYKKEPNLAEDIKIRRLEWAGDIVRMVEEWIPKKVLNGNFHTTNKWEDQELDGRMWFRGMHYNCWG
jgi:hypothetical protein